VASPADTGTPVDRLRGRSFVGATVTESGNPRPVVTGTELTVSFSRNDNTGEDVVVWSGGCNHTGGAVTVTEDRLDITHDGAGTAVGCTDDLHAQDAWFTEFFETDPHWSLDDGVLRLMSGYTIIVLDERS
jgi:heat shock protein HslJ